MFSVSKDLVFENTGHWTYGGLVLLWPFLSVTPAHHYSLWLLTNRLTVPVPMSVDDKE